MTVVRGLSSGSMGVPAGAWRWAALGFLCLALASAGLAVATPNAVGWAGVMLLAAIGAVASLFLFAIWPKERLNTADARRVAEAAARANVAWAITGTDGAVLDCNEVYRRCRARPKARPLHRPNSRSPAKPSAAVLYRLTRGAAEGTRARGIFRRRRRASKSWRRCAR